MSNFFLRETGHLGDGTQDLRNWPAFSYTVEPHEPNLEIDITNCGGPNRPEWRVRRISEGSVGDWSKQHFKTAEEALAALEAQAV